MATPGRPITDEDKRRVQRLHSVGRTITEISKEAMVSRPTVRKILEKKC